jgi:hypothetical protein
MKPYYEGHTQADMMIINEENKLKNILIRKLCSF